MCSAMRDTFLPRFMSPCSSQESIRRRTRLAARILSLSGLLFAAVVFVPPRSHAQTFPLADAKDLVMVNVKADTVEYKGRKAIRITNDSQKDGFALLRGSDFQDGTIEADIALKITTPPGVRMPGFVGVAFRARPDASRYELFYLRPGNSHADDQAMRNHCVQYSYEPNFNWYKLRREWPSVYESHAELQTETWTKVRIEAKGRSARLFIGGSDQPSLVVDGLKGEDVHGGVALWGTQGEEAYFSDLRVTNSTPLPIKNGSDSSGIWQVKGDTDYGPVNGTLRLTRDGNKLTGTWSGDLGNAKTVTGTWRNGYVELSFPGDWPLDEKGTTTAPTVATLAGWFDGDSGSGRMKVEARADGRWSAARKP